MKKLLIIAFSLLFTVSFAQKKEKKDKGSKEKEHVKNVELRSLGPITVENEILGYYSFTRIDKIDKKNELFGLDIYDNNLSPTQSIELKRPKGEYCLGIAFNGDHFCISFVNAKKKSTDLLILNMEGKETGKLSNTKLNRMEVAFYSRAGNTENLLGGSLIGVPGYGFVRQNFISEGTFKFKTTYELIDNKGKTSWTYTPNVTKLGKIVTGNIFMANNDVIVVQLSGRKSAFSGKIKNQFLVLNAKDGQERFALEESNSDFTLLPLGVNYNNDTKGFYVYGEYFTPGAKVYKHRSLGYYLQELDASGKVIKENQANWINDFGKLAKVTKKGKVNGYYTLTHTMFKTADNHFYVVGEQYKKAFNPAGILGMISQNVNIALAQVTINDMLIYDFNPDFTLNEIKNFDKPKTRVWLQEGSLFLKPKVLALMVKYWGVFDFTYMSLSKDKQQFGVGYISRKNEFGNIMLNKDKEMVADKFKTDNKKKRTLIFPAKPGYLCVFEYTKKEKKLEHRMEKLNQ